jgi:sporulation protein YlmC with PRC-barrel domain
MCRGMTVVDDRSGDALASVTGVFVHPDLGKIEGLFVRAGNGDEFLAVQDITHWGTTIVVRDPDAIAPIDERVRLAALWDEGRTVLRQKIVLENGAVVGTCADVQFETDTFRLEWLFPRRWFRWGRPLPASSILEVRPDAIVVREGTVPVPTAVEQPAIAALEATIGSTPAQG